MNLKERLQQIAKNKLRKTQISPTNVRKNNTRTAKKSIKNEKTEKVEIASRKTKNNNREIPDGNFGYSRPAEARPPSETVRELTKRFQEQLIKKNKNIKKIRISMCDLKTKNQD